MFEKLKTPEDLKRRQTELKARFVESLGGFPERTPLNPRMVSKEHRDGYHLERVIYESRPNHHVTAALFLVSLFLYPLVQMIGGGYVSGQTTLYPIIAAPLVLVGTMMIGGLRHVAWDDPTEAVPAFLTLIMMPLAVSITEGIAFGLLAYAVLKIAAGRRREVHPLIYVFAVLFLGRYIWLR